MPVSTDRSANVRTRKTRLKRPDPKAAFQEPLVPEAKTRASDRPTDHNGIPVAREELIPSNLAQPNTFFKVTRLFLADGTSAFGCRDCTATRTTRAEIMAHRNEEHGARFGKKTPKLVYVADDEPGDVVLPPRAEGQPAPGNMMQWTMAEWLAVAPSIAALGDLITRAEQERDAAVAELREREAHDRENAVKLANYDAVQAELVERRMAMKNSGSYEDLKNEVAELRTWKKNMIKRLTPLGFEFKEEEK